MAMMASGQNSESHRDPKICVSHEAVVCTSYDGYIKCSVLL